MSKVTIDWEMVDAWHWHATMARHHISTGNRQTALDILDALIHSLSEKRGA